MKNFSSYFSGLVVASTLAFSIGEAKALRLVDQLTPGSKIEFYLTLNGSKEKAKNLEYDVYLCDGPFNCRLLSGKFTGTFEGQNIGSKDVFFEFRHDGNATDWRQAIKRPDGRISDTGLVNIRRIGLPKGGVPEYEVPGTFQTLTNDNYRIPDVISSAGVDLFALVYTDVYVENNPNGFLDGNWSVGQTLGDINISIVNGQVDGIRGIWWATGEWVPSFDADGKVTYSHTGVLYDSVPQDVFISQHYQVPGHIPIIGPLIAWRLTRRMKSVRESLAKTPLKPQNLLS